MKILHLDDVEDQLDLLSDTVERLKEQEGHEIVITPCKSVEETKELDLDRFDVAIVDLNLSGLADPTDEGDRFSKNLIERGFRLPVVIWSALAADYECEGFVMRAMAKGDDSAEEVIKYASKVVRSGLPALIGRKGRFEEALTSVLCDSVIPNIDAWIDRLPDERDQDEAVASSLTRFLLDHFFDSIDESNEKAFSEEFYLKAGSPISTGSIVQVSDLTEKDLLVINPSCDLVPRGEEGMKTEKLYLLPIIGADEICESVLTEVKSSRKKDALKKLMSNRHEVSDSGHWIPQSKLYKGGLVQFRDIFVLPTNKLDKLHSVGFRVNPRYIGDIQGRFSSFLSRQGQPDVCNISEIEKFFR